MNPLSLREICAKATNARRFLKFSRWSKDAPINGYAIEVEGKVPYLASAGVAEPNHTLIVGEEFRRQITTGYTASEVEANARLIARFSPETALAVYEALEDALSGCPACGGSGRENPILSETELGQAPGSASHECRICKPQRDALRLLDGRTEP